ncbi:hypothetical protein ACFLTE_04850 [Bacteroidota bacterium]
MKLFKFVIISIILFVILTSSALIVKLQQDENLQDKTSWEYQLNEMNYLVLKSSSINVINGIFLTSQQARELKELAKKIESLNLSIPNTYGNTFNEFVGIRKTFIEITYLLKSNKPVPDSLKHKAFLIRKKETDIIKKTIISAEKSGYKKGECIICHASPEYFPKGDISKYETRPVSEKKRGEIDLAHVKGIFQDEGISMLWELKSNVDKILTNGQKYILKSFRCCLIPPGNLSNPSNIGQAFVTNEWINYFKSIRALSDDDWENYKQLYFLPIDDLIEATLPGIKKKYKQGIMKNAETVIESSRKLDKIDFELQKEELCLKLQDALSIDFLIGENTRQIEERQFLAAMFLLFPGSIELYDEIIKKEDR